LLRKRDPNKKSQYFIEKEMNELVKQYKKDRSNEQLFKQIEPSLTNIINGMINKQFYGNYHVKNNRMDATSDCMQAILSSLDRYNPDKGRLFAYTNRIVKNTLMSFYRKSRKIRDNEMNYNEITRNIEENELDDDIALKLSMKNQHNNDLTVENTSLSNCTCKNVVLDIDTSIYIIYKYVNYLQTATQFYLDNSDIYKQLIDDLIYDTTVNFEFENYIDSIIMNKYDIYNNILDNLNNSLYNIIEWLKENYSESIYVEPESYDGEISNRALGYIRNFVKKQLKNDITKKYGVHELIQFLQYIVYKRYAEHGED
jgi:DNA-directed RNA polymerase specialized sigma24 family protein